MSKKPTRMEQLGNLLTAMIAVIVSGSSDLMLANEENDYLFSPQALALNYIDIDPSIRLQFRSGGKYNGTLRRIARDLNFGRSHVERVFHGATRSHIVANAIIEAISEMEGPDGLHNLISLRPAPPRSPRPKRTSAPSRPPFSEAELKLFRNKPYRGIQKGIVASLGVSETLVQQVIHGHARSARVLAEFKSAIKRVDAELAAKKGGNA